jgi:hypothetical protein
MIDTRERAYAARLPATDALLATNLPAQLIGRRTGVDASLTAVETANDVAALGTARQREQWARIRALEEALRSAPPGDETDAARDKLRLIKGALLWKLDENFKASDYATRTSLRAIDAALNEAQDRWARVQRARAIAPTNTGEFARRIAALNERLDDLSLRLHDAALRQDRFLSQVAQQELLAQKQRLGAYEVQSEFALGDIYDRAANAPLPGAAEPAAPAPRAEGKAP